MAVTFVVLSGSEPGLPELTLTLDSPRIVIGRSEGCDLRLPDTSVSHRHASLRQRGGEYVQALGFDAVVVGHQDAHGKRLPFSRLGHRSVPRVSVLPYWSVRRGDRVSGIPSLFIRGQRCAIARRGTRSLAAR